MRHIKPSRPVKIDSVDTMFDKSHLELSDIQSVEQDRRLHDLTDNKYITRVVLENSGIAIPRGILISPDDENIEGKIRTFIDDFPDMQGYVLKGLHGAHGNAVLLFDTDEKTSLFQCANDFVYTDEQLRLVEERIVPPTTELIKQKLWISDDEGNTIHPDEIDYNFRILVTLDPTYPKAITGEVRYRENDGLPVNLTLHEHPAMAATLDVLEDPELLQKLYMTSEKATAAVCKAVNPDGQAQVGYAGVDLMIDKKGNVYVIEVNAGGNVGGLGTLARLTRKPLPEIRDILIPNWLEKVVKDKGLEKKDSVSRLKPIRISAQDRQVILKSFISGDDLKGARRFVIEQLVPEILAIDESPHKTIAKLIDMGFTTTHFVQLRDFIKDALDFDPENDYLKEMKPIVDAILS
jgi:hypothetical protein